MYIEVTGASHSGKSTEIRKMLAADILANKRILILTETAIGIELEKLAEAVFQESVASATEAAEKLHGLREDGPSIINDKHHWSAVDAVVRSGCYDVVAVMGPLYPPSNPNVRTDKLLAKSAVECGVKVYVERQSSSFPQRKSA